MPSMIEKKAEKVVGELGLSGFSFDPIMVIGIITALIQLFKGCNLSAWEAKRRATSPRLLDRVVLRRQIRKSILGVQAIDEDAMHAAILDTAKASTTEDFKAMYAEVP